MTPEEAEKIFYEAYSRAIKEAGTKREPLIQRKISLEAWQVVIDRINEENIKSIAESYLNQCGS